MAKYTGLKYPFADGHQGKTGTKPDHVVTGADVQTILKGQTPAVQADALSWLARQERAPKVTTLRTKVMTLVQKYEYA